MQKPVICIGAALVDALFHITNELLLSTASDANVSKTAVQVNGAIATHLTQEKLLKQVTKYYPGE